MLVYSKQNNGKPHCTFVYRMPVILNHHFVNEHPSHKTTQQTFTRAARGVCPQLKSSNRSRLWMYDFLEALFKALDSLKLATALSTSSW